jgi:capsular exopolysaccharide synthesis family protein
MELREYWAVVRKHLWIILLTTLVGAGAAFYFTYNQPASYRAQTTLEMDPSAGAPSDPSAAYTYAYYNTRLVEQAVKGFQTKMAAPQFRDEMKDRLGLDQLGGSVQIRHVAETQFVEITSESRDPALAQALANTAAQVLIDNETSRQQARLREALDDLESEIETLEENVASAREQLALMGSSGEAASEFERQERARLESELNRSETRLVVLLDSAEEFRKALAQRADYISVYTPAQLPGSAIVPPVTQRTLLGAASGLVIGLSIAFLLEYLDDTIRTPEDVKRALPVSVLGALPRMRRSEEGIPLVVAGEPFGPLAEAFRSLRTSVQFSGVDKPLRTLLVTSPLPSDGKTFTAANLAAVMAQGGHSVILVDTDLRRPMQHNLFGLSKEPGLTAKLLSSSVNERQVAEARLDRLFTEMVEEEPALQETDVEGLRVMCAGTKAHNPAELLSSRRFELLVAWLKKQADLVVFDSQPVLAVTDAPLLSTQMDGVLLVVDAGKTRRPAAMRAVERLTDVGGNVLGAVVNRLPSRGDGYYYNYYYYRSYYSHDDGSRNGQERGWLGRVFGLGRREGAKAPEQEQERERGS